MLFAAAALAGAVNAVAGGGTLLTFPALLFAGQNALVANATSNVALWPGLLSSFWTYRSEMKSSRRELAVLVLPSFLGGLFGALLLVYTPLKTFDAVVPYLILAATLLFIAQTPLARWRARRAAEARKERESKTHGARPPSAVNDSSAQPGAAVLHRVATSADPSAPIARWIPVLAFQFGVSVYGGYFGAGMGIMMLAAFGFLGFTNIHHANGLKNLNALCINGIAAVIFIARGLVDWRLALWMALGAILGGFAGAGMARRVGQPAVRRIVICIGFALTIWLLVGQLRGN